MSRSAICDARNELKNLSGISYKSCNNEKRVININTKQVYNSITEAAKTQNISESVLGNKLRGNTFNNTELIFLNTELANDATNKFNNRAIKRKKSKNKVIIATFESGDILEFPSINKTGKYFKVSNNFIEKLCEGEPSKKKLNCTLKYKYYE